MDNIIRSASLQSKNLSNKDNNTLLRFKNIYQDGLRQLNFFSNAVNRDQVNLQGSSLTEEEKEELEKQQKLNEALKIANQIVESFNKIRKRNFYRL